jgi:hypothetical protein
MKSKPEFRAWKKGLVVFDTSVLLDLYFYSSKTRNEVIKSYLNGFEGRLWIPNQAKFEFDQNKEKILGKIKDKYKFFVESIAGSKDSNSLGKVNDFIGKIGNQIKTFKETTAEDTKHPYYNRDTTDEFLKAFDEFTKSFGNFKKKIEQENKERFEYLDSGKDINEVEEIIESSFEVGKGFSFDEKMEIIQEGTIRYPNKIPPGYEDDDKSGFAKYGDLFLWKEILLIAKEKSSPIIFVINDLKEDWWSRESKKEKKPRQELIQELKDFGGQELMMYDASEFLHTANRYFGMSISDRILKEVEEVTEDHRKRPFDYNSGLWEYMNKLNTFRFTTGEYITGVLLNDFENGRRWYFIPQENLRLFRTLQDKGDFEAAEELKRYIRF